MYDTLMVFLQWAEDTWKMEKPYTCSYTMLHSTKLLSTNQHDVVGVGNSEYHLKLMGGRNWLPLYSLLSLPYVRYISFYGHRRASSWPVSYYSLD